MCCGLHARLRVLNFQAVNAFSSIIEKPNFIVTILGTYLQRSSSGVSQLSFGLKRPKVAWLQL